MQTWKEPCLISMPCLVPRRQSYIFNSQMIRFLLKKSFYGVLVMLGVVVAVFFLFQGFGDPSRLVLGQRADASTQENIRKELYLDKPLWKQFFLYLNDVSPIAIHSKEDIAAKQLHNDFAGGNTKVGIKWPY